MKRDVSIVEATPAHLSTVARQLRREEVVELAGANLVGRHLMYQLWQKSIYRRAGFVDGEIAAVWGCTGMLLSPIAEAWLFTTPVIDINPMVFVKTARQELRRMLETKAKLVSACMVGCERPARLWTMLGFTLGDPIPATSGAMFHPLVMERP